jgi:glucose-1-phosphate adenylyltransferase
VAAGAVVRESVILTDSVIEKDAVVERTILDKKVVIHEGARVGGTAADGTLIVAMVGKNSQVLPGMMIEPGAVIGTDVIGNDYPDAKLVRSKDYIQTKRLPYEV